MVGGQVCIRCAARRGNGLTGFIDDKLRVGILGTDTAHIANVMHQQGHGIVQPVFRLERVSQEPALDNLLAAERYHHGVIDVMIKRVRIADPLKHQMCSSPEITCKFRVAAHQNIVDNCLKDIAPVHLRSIRLD